MKWMLACAFVICSCAEKQKTTPEYPEKLPITEQAKELTKLPEYVAPIKSGGAVPISKNEASPIDGIVITEEQATATAELRVAYDEIYGLAGSNTKYLTSLVTIQEKELFRAESMIKSKEEQLKEIRDSWWERNKAWVGLGAGLIVGAGACLLTGKVWSEIEKDGAK